MGRLLWIMTEIRDLLLWPVVVAFPRNPKKVLLGAWSGRNFGCNPKYFFLYLLENTDCTCVWVGQPHLKEAVLALPRAKFARKGSLAALWHALTAGCFVCNINWRGDVIDLPTFRRVTLVNPFHGLAFKKVGEHQFPPFRPSECVRLSERGGSALRRRLRKLLERWNSYRYPQESWLSVASPAVGELYAGAFPGRFSRSRTVVAGQPRNDFLVVHRSDSAFCSRLKAKLADRLGLPADKRWFLYLPTFRYGTDEVYSFVTSPRAAEISRLLEAAGAVVVEKQHPRVLQRLHVAAGRVGNVVSLSEQQGAGLDLQELLLVSDRLVSDYSSCFFDFALLDRPCVHFAYDWESYRDRDTGVYYDLKEVAAGPVCATEEELVSALAAEDAALLAQRGPRLRELLAGETGHACERLAKRAGLA